MTAQEVITVLVVDDHHAMRETLRWVISRQPDLAVVGEATDGQEAVEMARQLTPSVVVLDMRLPVQGGLAAARAIKRLPNPPAIVMMTAYDFEFFEEEARNAGADVVTVKDSLATPICDAIRMAVERHSG
jgi:DNA-binding NarL/FixJ family response regulator